MDINNNNQPAEEKEPVVENEAPVVAEVVEPEVVEEEAPVQEQAPEPVIEEVIPAPLPSNVCPECFGEGLLGDPQGANSVCPTCSGTGKVN